MIGPLCHSTKIEDRKKKVKHDLDADTKQPPGLSTECATHG